MGTHLLVGHYRSKRSFKEGTFSDRRGRSCRPGWLQRVHENDLVGYLQEQGGFEVLNLPAIAPRSQTYDLRGGRTYTRQQGELLHPAHEPADTLIELKREMGPIAFSHSTSRILNPARRHDHQEKVARVLRSDWISAG